MKKQLYLGSMLFSLLMSSSAMAQEKRYGASPQQSTWEMVANTPLECRLVHPILTSVMQFSSRASKKNHFRFWAKNASPMGATRNVSLISMPPPWRPGESADRMTTIKFFQQFDGYVGGQTAWGILVS